MRWHQWPDDDHVGLWAGVSIPKRVSDALARVNKSVKDRLNPVSIPKRVSDALALGYLIAPKGLYLVSIPKRVSDALALLAGAATALGVVLFQSLRGFPMRWHDPEMRSLVGTEGFQSLRGFPMRWHSDSLTNAFFGFKVSIPKRVSDALAPP